MGHYRKRLTGWAEVSIPNLNEVIPNVVNAETYGSALTTFGITHAA